MHERLSIWWMFVSFVGALNSKHMLRYFCFVGLKQWQSFSKLVNKNSCCFLCTSQTFYSRFYRRHKDFLAFNAGDGLGLSGLGTIGSERAAAQHQYSPWGGLPVPSSNAAPDTTILSGQGRGDPQLQRVRNSDPGPSSSGGEFSVSNPLDAVVLNRFNVVTPCEEPSRFQLRL